MRSLIVLVALAAGCGKEIGDPCIVSTDCTNGGGFYGQTSTQNRICLSGSESGGYCSIMGCDYNTCPQEATCIRFFTGQFANRTCGMASDCSLDELCDLQGHCVPRSTEIRYCMRSCKSDGDCRDGYECRDLPRMIADGGEPVLAPGVPIDQNAPKFCASKPPAPPM